MKFQKISLGVLLLGGIAYFAFGGSSQDPLLPTEQLVVFDIAGKRVGPVIDIDSLSGGFGSGSEYRTAVVAFRSNDMSFPVRVMRNRFGGYQEVVFESTDCSGPAFMEPLFFAAGFNVPPALPLVGVGFPGTTVYVADSGAATQTIVAGTKTGLNNFPIIDLPEDCTDIGGQTLEAIPAQTFTNLDNKFTPPFVVR